VVDEHQTCIDSGLYSEHQLATER